MLGPQNIHRCPQNIILSAIIGLWAAGLSPQCRGWGLETGRYGALAEGEVEGGGENISQLIGTFLGCCLVLLP